jgi:NAD(P)-dependent dehydrogenase (short-subunit alcohol dehydrogenase family)
MVLLVPALERGADSSPDRHSRVVFTASSGVYFDPVVYFDTFVPGPGRDKKSRYDLYNQSKVGNCIIAREAARRYAEKNIVVTSVNPGNIRTELTRHTTAWELWFIVRLATSCLAVSDLVCQRWIQVMRLSGYIIHANGRPVPGRIRGLASAVRRNLP